MFALCREKTKVGHWATKEKSPSRKDSCPLRYEWDKVKAGEQEKNCLPESHDHGESQEIKEVELLERGRKHFGFIGSFILSGPA